jgi:hypothetical protein
VEAADKAFGTGLDEPISHHVHTFGVRVGNPFFTSIAPVRVFFSRSCFLGPLIEFIRGAAFLHTCIDLGCALGMAAYDSQPLGRMDKQATLESRAHASRSMDGDESEEYHESLRGFTRADRADMERMGKVQELKRNYRPLSALAFTVILQGTWEVLLT